MKWTTIVSLLIRALQIFLSFVILGLSAYVANWYNVETLTASPSQVNFLIFVPVYTLISVIYLEGITRFMPRLANPYVIMAAEGLNILFYFAGMIALAVFLNALLFCRGTVCGAARADTGLAGVQWLLFVFTAALNGMEVFRAGLRRPARAGLKGPYPKEMKDTPIA